MDVLKSLATELVNSVGASARGPSGCCEVGNVLTVLRGGHWPSPQERKFTYVGPRVLSLPAP